MTAWRHLGACSSPAKTCASPTHCELLEETGYAGDPPELLGTIWPIPALLSMRISTIVVRNARRTGEPRPDQNEELVVEIVPVHDIPALIKTGRIDHGVCVAGLLWWLMLDRPDLASQSSWTLLSRCLGTIDLGLELTMPVLVTQLPLNLTPDPGRLITRFFCPGDLTRAREIVERALAYPEPEIEKLLADLERTFGGKHSDLHGVLAEHFEQVRTAIPVELRLTQARQLFLGACFTMEYAIESAPRL